MPGSKSDPIKWQGWNPGLPFPGPGPSSLLLRLSQLTPALSETLPDCRGSCVLASAGRGALLCTGNHSEKQSRQFLEGSEVACSPGSGSGHHSGALVATRDHRPWSFRAVSHQHTMRTASGAGRVRLRGRHWDPRENRQLPFTALRPHKSSEIKTTAPPCDGATEMLPAVPSRAAQSSREQARLQGGLDSSFSSARGKGPAQGGSQRFDLSKGQSRDGQPAREQVPSLRHSEGLKLDPLSKRT